MKLKKTMKKFLLIALSVLLVGSTVGCGGGGSANGSQSAVSQAASSGSQKTFSDLSKEIDGNKSPTKEQISTVEDSMNDTYLKDAYAAKIPDDYNAYPMKDSPEITVWMPIDAYLSSIIKSLNDFEPYKEAQKLTGIKVKFTSPPVGKENDAFSTMIASGSLPDIIVDADKYQGGVEAGVTDGAYQDLTELIPKYAPNYADFRNSDENRRKTTMTDTKKLVGIYGLSPYSEWMWFGPLIKKEALQKTGLAVPETVDEWHTFLLKCKQLGYKQPLNYGSNYGQIFTGIINGAYGAWDWTFLDKNGKVAWGPGQPGAKDYLATMAQWQSEGLLNQDWTTADFNQRMAEAVSSDCAAIMDSPDTMWGFWKTDKMNVDFVGAPNPVLKKGDKPQTTYKNWENTGRPAAITTQCKNVEAALRWLDFGFTKKGWELFNWGAYGTVHLVNDKGQPYYQDSSLMYNDPEHQPLANLIWKYRVHTGPNIRDEHNSNPLITAKGSYSGKIREEWTKENDTGVAMPPVSLTPEEAAKEANIGTQLSTLRNEYFAKIIMGQLPVSKYDEFLQKAKSMGMNEWLGLWQAALNRYNAR